MTSRPVVVEYVWYHAASWSLAVFSVECFWLFGSIDVTKELNCRIDGIPRFCGLRIGDESTSWACWPLVWLLPGMETKAQDVSFQQQQKDARSNNGIDYCCTSSSSAVSVVESPVFSYSWAIAEITSIAKPNRSICFRFSLCSSLSSNGQ